MLTGLFFGSFNPMHIGHLALANYLTEYTPIRQLWFVPSPLNPLKNTQELLPYDLRCELIEQAIRKDIRFKFCALKSCSLLLTTQSGRFVLSPCCILIIGSPS